jgi:hypothetical protein
LFRKRASTLSLIAHGAVFREQATTTERGSKILFARLGCTSLEIAPFGCEGFESAEP